MTDVFDIGYSLRDDVSLKKGQFYENFVDIYDFFDVLYNLFDKEGIILNENPKDQSDLDRIVFVQEYPDEVANFENNYVVFRLGERRFWNEKGTGTNAPKIIQRKPRSLKSGYDIVENNIIEDKGYLYDNTITLEVFSKSLQRVMQVTRLLENMMLKHRGVLKRYVQEVVYVGQTPTEHTSANIERRLFSRSLVFRVITYGQFSLLTEEIKYINNF